VVIAELAFGISKIRPDERAQRLADGLEAWRTRFAGRIFTFTDEAALSYGEPMGEATRAGHPMSAPDGRIAAIARVHTAPLATQNLVGLREAGGCWWIPGGAERGDVSKQDLTLAPSARAIRVISTILVISIQ